MEDIEDKLEQNLLDLKRMDCSIVFAGECFIYLIKKCINVSTKFSHKAKITFSDDL